MKYQVEMSSDEYGAEVYGPYEGEQEALKAKKQLQAAALKLKDGVERKFLITPYEKEDE